MAEQNEGHVALSIEQEEDSTANTSSNPAAEKTVPSASQSFSVDQNGHPAINTNDDNAGPCAYNIGYYLIAPVLVLIIASISAITVLPLLLPLYFIAHIVQVFWSTDDDDKLGKFMGFLAKWLCICFVLISIELLLCMLIFGVTPSLKGRKVHDELSITRLIGVLAIICTFLSYSMFTRYVLGYRRLKKKPSEEEKNRLYEALIGAINSLLYLLALFSVTRVAPVLKKDDRFHGLPTYKWIRMILIVAFGHHAIRVITSSVAIALRNNCFIKAGKDGLTKVQGYENSKNFLGFIETATTGQATSTEEWINHAAYYAQGLRKSVNFLLTSLLVLLTWILYLGFRLNQSSSSDEIKEVYHIGLLTFACISGGAFLWLVKCGIILSWKARLVYGKLYNQISRAADQLYLIGIIAGPKLDILGILKKGRGGGRAGGGDDDGDHHTELGDQKDEAEEEGTSTSNDQIDPPAPANRQGSDGNLSAGKQNAKLNDRAKSKAREILVREEKKGILHTSRIMRMARYFMDAEKPLSRDGYLSEFVQHLKKNNPKPIEEKKIRDLHGDEIDEVDYKLFKKQLEDERCKMEDMDRWIVTNHQVCLKLGRTLAGAMEVVDFLSNIMIIILVAAVTIVWLLISGIEITRVLILIASPLLTASFLFGKSATTLFQGLVFIFITRPFDVGDLCTINNVQLEVKRIGVSKTKFSKVGATDDEVVYPNTILAKTSIVNHNSIVDPNDHVELRLSSSTSMRQIKQLESKIEKYMADNHRGFNKHPNDVLVKDIGKTIGISVYFKHDEESIKAAMPTEALRKKIQRRNKFLQQVKTILEELNMGEIREPQFPGSQLVVHGGISKLIKEQNKYAPSDAGPRQFDEEKQDGTEEAGVSDKKQDGTEEVEVSDEKQDVTEED